MGLFSKIFSKKIKKSASSVNFLQTYSGGSGGWGLARFNSIYDAHLTEDDLIDEFDLDQEGSQYSDCYDIAYFEELEKAEIEALISGKEVQLNEDSIERNAHRLAIELVHRWLSGEEWIPQDILDWAWYEVSDHNR